MNSQRRNTSSSGRRRNVIKPGRIDAILGHDRHGLRLNFGLAMHQQRSFRLDGSTGGATDGSDGGRRTSTQGGSGTGAGPSGPPPLSGSLSQGVCSQGFLSQSQGVSVSQGTASQGGSQSLSETGLTLSQPSPDLLASYVYKGSSTSGSLGTRPLSYRDAGVHGSGAIGTETAGNNERQSRYTSVSASEKSVRSVKDPSSKSGSDPLLSPASTGKRFHDGHKTVPDRYSRNTSAGDRGGCGSWESFDRGTGPVEAFEKLMTDKFRTQAMSELSELRRLADASRVAMEKDEKEKEQASKDIGELQQAVADIRKVLLSVAEGTSKATKLLETNIPNAVKAVEKRVRSTEESLSVIMRASTAAATSAEAAATASKAAAAKTVTPTTLKSLLDEFLLGGEQDAQRFVQGLTLRGKDFPGGNDKKSPPRQRASCWGGSEDRLAQGETSAGARVAEPLREQRTRASLRLMKDGNQHIRGVKDGVSRGREAVGAHRQEASSRDSSLETCLELCGAGEALQSSPCRGITEQDQLNAQSPSFSDRRRQACDENDDGTEGGVCGGNYGIQLTASGGGVPNIESSSGTLVAGHCTIDNGDTSVFELESFNPFDEGPPAAMATSLEETIIRRPFSSTHVRAPRGSARQQQLPGSAQSGAPEREEYLSVNALLQASPEDARPQLQPWKLDSRSDADISGAPMSTTRDAVSHGRVLRSGIRTNTPKIRKGSCVDGIGVGRTDIINSAGSARRSVEKRGNFIPSSSPRGQRSTAGTSPPLIAARTINQATVSSHPRDVRAADTSRGSRIALRENEAPAVPRNKAEGRDGGASLSSPCATETLDVFDEPGLSVEAYMARNRRARGRHSLKRIGAFTGDESVDQTLRASPKRNRAWSQSSPVRRRCTDSHPVQAAAATNPDTVLHRQTSDKNHVLLKKSRQRSLANLKGPRRGKSAARRTQEQAVSTLSAEPAPKRTRIRAASSSDE